jgi:hypothetical protein
METKTLTTAQTSKSQHPIRSINLIDGVFTTEEAKEILTNLYNSKINFHNMKNFSHTERYGRPHAASLARIESLRISLQKVKEAIAEAEKSNQMIKINSAVEIGFLGELQ